MARATKTTAKKTTTQAKAASTKKQTATRKPAARKRSTKKNQMPEPVIVVSHDAIARKAYEIWLRKGRPAGLDETNWVEAEKELAAAA